MKIVKRIALALFLLCCTHLECDAVVTFATAPMPPESGKTIHFGDSIRTLDGSWKFHIGDSPTSPSGLLWASPGFDDSQWSNVDLTSQSGAVDPVAGFSGYVPGWTARGYPNYWGYAWYRTRVRVESPRGKRLAILGSSDLDDAYQMFVNGALLGSFGDFSNPKSPVAYNTQPNMFLMPDEDFNGEQVLAIRVWMDASTIALNPDAGGMHVAPMMGERAVVEAQNRLAWVETVRSYALAPVLAVSFLLVAIIALVLAFFDRSDRVYLWLTSVFFIMACERAGLSIEAWTQIVGLYRLLFASALATPIILGGWSMIWWVWFQQTRPAWIPKLILALTIFYAVFSCLSQTTIASFLPPSMNTTVYLTANVARMLLFLLVLAIVFRGIRQQGHEGWLALPAVLLMGVAQFQFDLSILHVQTVWFPFGAQLTLASLASIALIAAMSGLLLRRLWLSLKRQREMALDVKQAQEVQQVLLPEHVNLPGFRIETEYRPSLNVGGDFFQIIPHQADGSCLDGSVLIVAGDVTGKGLQAGMLVALLVGAIRSTAEVDSSPLYVLEALNRRLLGRNSAYATCLALRIARDGTVSLANAGHIPPYLNGIEIAIEGALPLGMAADFTFPVLNFKLEPGDTLTSFSDGIVEAQDAEGNLFGFERLCGLLKQHTSAAGLAEAAHHFGQTDDISVVSIIRE